MAGGSESIKLPIEVNVTNLDNLASTVREAIEKGGDIELRLDREMAVAYGNLNNVIQEKDPSKDISGLNDVLKDMSELIKRTSDLYEVANKEDYDKDETDKSIEELYDAVSNTSDGVGEQISNLNSIISNLWKSLSPEANESIKDAVKQLDAVWTKIGEVQRELRNPDTSNQDAAKDVVSKIADLMAQATESIKDIRTNVKDITDNTTTDGDNKKSSSLIARLFDLKAGVKESDSNEDKESKRMAAGVQMGVRGLQKGIDTQMAVFKKTLGIIEDLYAKVKQSSPLLETISSLIDLGVQLILMPIGNLLGEKMLPTIVEMLENLGGLWDEYDSAMKDGGSLSKIVSIALDKGVSIMANAILGVGNILANESNPILHNVGVLLNTLGEMLKNGEIVKIITTILSVTTTIFSQLEMFVGLIGAMYGSMYALKLVELQLLAEPTWLKDTGGGLALLAIALAGGGLGFAAGALTYEYATGTNDTLNGVGNVSGAVGNLTSNANGGYVPPTPGGSLHIVGEGNEGEYILTDTQYKELASGSNSTSVREGDSTNNVYFTINGATTDEIKDYIRDYVDEQIRQSRYRSGF